MAVTCPKAIYVFFPLEGNPSFVQLWLTSVSGPRPPPQLVHPDSPKSILTILLPLPASGLGLIM